MARKAPEQKIKINSASREELMSIEGVGEETADAIINYREIHGRFQNVEELRNVFGMGGKKLEDFKSHVEI